MLSALLEQLAQLASPSYCEIEIFAWVETVNFYKQRGFVIDEAFGIRDEELAPDVARPPRRMQRLTLPLRPRPASILAEDINSWGRTTRHRAFPQETRTGQIDEVDARAVGNRSSVAFVRLSNPSTYPFSFLFSFIRSNASADSLRVACCTPSSSLRSVLKAKTSLRTPAFNAYLMIQT